MQYYVPCEMCKELILDTIRCKNKPDKDCLLRIYMEGFKHELDGEIVHTYNNDLMNSAYRLGREHAIMGDDIRSVDYLTGDEIIDRILYKNDDTI